MPPYLYEPRGAVYGRATFFKRRMVIMQAWADYLDAVAKTGKVDLPTSMPDATKDRQETGVRSVPVPLEVPTGSGASPYRIVYLNCPIEHE